MENLKNGTIPLDDDDLDAVAGGKKDNRCPKCGSSNFSHNNAHQHNTCRDCNHRWGPGA